ncbi:MAG TPA: FAD binding domain-containing protein [Anaerolineae bacterium]|mgnify:CR=1 FL=1|nr:FAD binding domain-containing protein [Anaerolineae bacterium]HQK15376.1 FAD binding domain-containing protein [Anaerolineae bacterium]
MLRNVKVYKRPTNIEEAIALVQSNPNAVYIGGGAWTVAQGDPHLEMVVDLQDAGLNFIDSTVDGVRLGATATLQAIIDHPDAGTLADGLLARAAGYTQSRNLREQGTLGGTLIVAGPADPITTALLVLDANILYADPVMHTAPFTSFVAYRDRLIKTRVLITEVRVKRPPARSAAAFEVVGRSPKDKPIVCAAAYVAVEEGLPAEVRLAIGGADARPARLYKTEHLLKGQLLTQEKVMGALPASLSELNPIGDFRGSAEYRLEMAKVLLRRAILSAWEKARRSI